MGRATGNGLQSLHTDTLWLVRLMSQPSLVQQLRLLDWAAALALIALMGGCAAPWQRLDAIARHGGLDKRIVRGNGFDHVVYERPATVRVPGSPAEPLIVFLEGDGLPWASPERPSADATARDPIGLALALATPGRIAYVARPCYHEFARASGCSPADWTSGRYSLRVIASVAAVIAALDADAAPLWIVGYSGGGALAVLAAPRLPRLEQLVTVAGNLDTEAWTTMHGYLPLSASVNPATTAPLPASIRQLHLYGTADRNIPPGTAIQFVARQPNARARAMAGFDHICCWTRAWPNIWADITRGAAQGR